MNRKTIYLLVISLSVNIIIGQTPLTINGLPGATSLANSGAHVTGTSTMSGDGLAQTQGTGISTSNANSQSTDLGQANSNSNSQSNSNLEATAIGNPLTSPIVPGGSIYNINSPNNQHINSVQPQIQYS